MSRPESDLDPTAASVIVDTVADMEELVAVVTAFAGGIVFEFDRDGTYLRVLTGDPALLIRPVGELIGRPISDVLGAAGERFHDAVRTVFDTEEPHAFEYTLDVQAGRRTFSCELRPHTRAGASGRPGPKTVTLLARDITSKRALEGELVQAQRLGALGLLAASVGHEIRQPLAYVSTSLDTLERELAGATLPERAAASLANIRSGARRISEIAASLDLLAGRRATEATALVDVQRPLKAALDLCASELSGLSVERSLALVPPVRGNEGELCQVFANLLLNAAQSMAREGGRSGQVKVSLSVVAERAGDRVRVSVSDQGSGIAPEHLERVFDPFFTTKSTHGGTGLGLFITRGIVQAHGGTIEVTSTVGAGTTVDVFLPAQSPFGLTAEPITGVRPVVAPREESASRRLSLLLVDDEPRFLESLRLALEDAHQVTTFTRAAEALAVLEQDPRRYDVVVCDLAMPEIDGATFFERMQALGVGDRFVLMTGGAFTQRSTDFVARNACPRIGKPFLLDSLLALLQDLMQGRSAS